MAARRSARNAPCAKEAQEGVKGGTLAGGSPFAGGLSRPQPLRFTDARSYPVPGRGWNPAPTIHTLPPLDKTHSQLYNLY